MRPILPMRGKSVRFPVFVCLAVLTAALLGSSSEAWAQKRVLLLESYHDGLAWSDSIRLGVVKALEREAPGTEVVVEYMDAIRIGPTGREAQLRDEFTRYLELKTKALPPDLVIAADNPALDFILGHRARLAPGIPLVFCGINNFNPKMLSGQDLVTGVAETPSFVETITVGLALWPKARNLLVLGEQTLTFKANEALLEKALPGFKDKLSTVYFNDPDIQAIESRVSSLTADWLVLPMARPREDGKVMPAQVGAGRIARASPVPVLACWDFWMGSGILGGKVVSGLAQGEAAGAMAARILNGQAPASIPAAESPNVYEFDYGPVARFGLNTGLFPPGSRLINRPVSFYEANSRLVWTYILFTGLLLGALAAMAVNIHRRGYAERKLAEQIRFVTTLLEALPIPVFHKDTRGVYLGCNRAFEQLFGRPRDQVIGRVAQDIFPALSAGKFADTDQEAMHSEGRISYEWQVDSPAGKREVLFSKASYRDAEGRVAGLVGVGADLTEIRLAQQALRESETKYRSLFETMAQGVVYMGADGAVLSANPAACRILGLSLDEMHGRTSLDPRWRTVREDGSEFPGPEHPVMVALRRGRPVYDVVMGVHNPREDGVRWIVVNAMPEFLPGQEAPYRAYASFEDITRLKQAEHAQFESESLYRQLLAGMQEGFVRTSLEGAILECNDAFARMLGRPREELSGMSSRSITPERWHAMEYHIEVEQVLTRGYSEVYEKEYAREDGMAFHVEIRTYLTRDARGEPSGLWAIVRDVTEQRRMREVMVQNEKMMSVGGLAAGMAHEINNPLGGIIQSAQVVIARLSGEREVDRRLAQEAGCDLESMKRYLERRGILELMESLREAAKRAAKIVSNMLEFSRRGDSGKVFMDVNILADAALELVSNDFDIAGRFDFREMEVVREYGQDLPPIMCSPTQIEQVLVNILRNAAQAMAGQHQRGRRPRIVVRTARENGFLRLEVEDNGPGMTEQVRKQAFEPFFTTKKPGEGTGLGLSVSYYIIATNHDGQMRVESEPGGGTRFVIRIPYKQRQIPDAVTEGA